MYMSFSNMSFVTEATEENLEEQRKKIFFFPYSFNINIHLEIAMGIAGVEDPYSAKQETNSHV